MSKHTQGPWEVSLGRQIVSSHDGMLVADVQSRADARLIAAAPELLDALCAIADCCEETRQDRDYLSRKTEIRGIARHAIAKATGKQK